MKFTKFLNEQAEEVLLYEGVKDAIIVQLNDMSKGDLRDFGEWLFNEFFGNDEEYFENEDSTEIEDLIELLGDMSNDDLEYIMHMIIDDDEDDVSAHTDDNENIEDEAVETKITEIKRKKMRRYKGSVRANKKLAHKKQKRTASYKKYQRVKNKKKRGKKCSGMQTLQKVGQVYRCKKKNYNVRKVG